jgi:FkbM family methyltransferase
MQTETKQCRYGRMTYPLHDVYIGGSLRAYGEYAAHELFYLRFLLRPGHVAIDVGANVGALTVGMADRVGPAGVIHAFEPQRAIHDLLCINVAPFKNIVVHHAAAGPAPGVIRVPPLDYDSVGNFGALSIGGSEGEEVPVLTIDSLNLPQLHLLKIDVEGMEIDVLRGSGETIRRCEPILFVENDREHKSEALISHIFDLGYRLWWHLTPLFRADNFFNNETNVLGNVWYLNMIGFPRHAPVKPPFPEVRSPKDGPRGADGAELKLVRQERLPES